MNCCPHCGEAESAEITSLGSANRQFLCVNGHSWYEVLFTPHSYKPPFFINGPYTVMLYCGPPAPFPSVPTPAELLRHAGLPWMY